MRKPLAMAACAIAIDVALRVPVVDTTAVLVLTGQASPHAVGVTFQPVGIKPVMSGGVLGSVARVTGGVVPAGAGLVSTASSTAVRGCGLPGNHQPLPAARKTHAPSSFPSRVHS